ncbi:MAG: TolC family protein [Muribaculaceae bacterium]|nr:TolC family protein [Muribaculaceae bacterium]
MKKPLLSSLRNCLCAILCSSAMCVSAQATQPGDEPVVMQGPVSLATFRTMALENNKQLMMSRERIRKAGYQRKEAFAAYLPAIDFTGSYIYNQRELSIFDSDQMLPTKTFDPATGTYQFNLVKDPSTGMPLQTPDGQYIPSVVALIPKEAMTYDIHNVFFGAVTLTQPIFMGGKIVAMNKLTRAAENAAKEMDIAEAENVIYAVDAAYWQIVSLKAKYRLAENFVNLLDTLNHNVNLMLEEGVVTRGDALAVEVKLNSAQVDFAKVKNGLALSRMVLAQICGLPVDAQFTLVDEDIDIPEPTPDVMQALTYDMEQVFSQRHDLRALEQGVEATRQQQKVALSSMLPNLALIGSYEFSNPNMYNGFSKRFKGGFSVGAMLTIPILHWGGSYNKYRVAKSDLMIRELQLEDAREKVTLQVSQASFKMQEAYKTYQMTMANLAKADENLRSANLAFREGVATTDNVTEAQTAWLKAHSEQVDAFIDLKLCQTYLCKALGTLQ